MKKNLTVIFSLAIISLANNNFAQTLFWDGGTANISTNGDGISQGGAGTWNTSLQNWDQGNGQSHVAWSSAADANFSATGIAVGAGTVTLAAPITANSITVTTTNYIITDGGNSANTLTVNSVTNSQTLTISNNIVNSAGFTKAGSGSLTLLAASSGLTGPLNVSAGTLQFGNNSTLAGPTGFGNVTIASNATFKLAPFSTSGYSQTISGAGLFSVQANSSSSTITLSSEANTFTGSVTINQATLSVFSISDIGGSDLGEGTNLIIGAGSSASALTYTGGGDTTTRTITLGGTSANTIINGNNLYGPLTLLGPLAFSGTGTTKHTLTLGGTSTYINVFGGTISDNTATNTALLKSGTGTWMLTGTNTYSGGTTFGANSGSLLITNDFALGAATNPVIFTGSGGALKSISNNVTLGIGRTVTVSNTFMAGFSVSDSNNFEVASFITGPGAVNKSSAAATLGTVRFSNDTNNFTGGFNMGFGNTEFTSVADAGIPCSLGAGNGMTNANSTSFAVLRYVGTNNSATHRPLSWTGTIGGLALDNTNTGTIAYLNTTQLVNGSGTKSLTLQGSNTGTNTLAQIINDNGGTTSLLKTGTGEWILTAANTYSGTTTIGGGTLLVNGSLSNGAVTVNSGGTLGGMGLIGGSVTVTNGGTLAAGDPNSASVTTLTITNSVTNSGTIFIKLKKSSLTNDKIIGIGTLVYGGTLSLTNLSGTLTTNDSFQIFTATNFQGAFSSITPATPGNGLAWNTNNLIVNGTLSIVAGAVKLSPVVTHFGISGTTVTIQATNGVAGGSFVLLSSTNVALPLSQWTPVLTNAFDGSGNLNLTTNINAAAAQQFFILSQ